MTTAHKAWNNLWLTKEKNNWIDADPFVKKAIPIFINKKYKKILDVGCGVGRHSLLLDQYGFQVTALDGSQNALDSINNKNTKIKTVKANHIDIPFEDNTFDAVLTFQSIHHGDKTSIKQSVNEVHRILKPNGTFFGTILSKKHEEFGKGKIVDSNTYIRDNGLDVGHPHTYVNAKDLVQLLNKFEVSYMKDAEIKPSRRHWFFCAETIK